MLPFPPVTFDFEVLTVVFKLYALCLLKYYYTVTTCHIGRVCSSATSAEVELIVAAPCLSDRSGYRSLDLDLWIISSYYKYHDSVQYQFSLIAFHTTHMPDILLPPTPNNPSRTWAHQSQLPGLPVPPLEDTCRRYLTALKALQDEKEHENTKRAVQAFLRSDGPRVQESLIEYAKNKHRCVSATAPAQDEVLTYHSYIEEFWYGR